MDNLSKWMGKLNPNTKLWELLIPGTHDTMTGTCEEIYYKTQNLTLEEQLKMGVRFLDLRLTRNMEAAHREWMSGINADEIFAIIKKFLMENDTETIIVRFQNANEKKDDYPEYGSALQGVIEAHGDMIYNWDESEEWPSLEKCKGKIVALECSPPSYGFNKIGTWQWAVNWHENSKIHLQDNWDGPDVEEKAEDISKNLYESCALANVLSLNHISATNGSIGNPVGYAKFLNPFLKEFILEKYNEPMAGVLIMDFVSPEDGKYIVECNKRFLIAKL